MRGKREEEVGTAIFRKTYLHTKKRDGVNRPFFYFSVKQIDQKQL
jgi:hypothetical protein